MQSAQAVSTERRKKLSKPPSQLFAISVAAKYASKIAMVSFAIPIQSAEDTIPFRRAIVNS
jgi:hypothetical protein